MANDSFQIGDGVNYGAGSDAYPATVIAVSASGKTVTVQADSYRRVDNNGYGGYQEYEYERNTEGATRKYTRRKNGRYIEQGAPAHAGYAALRRGRRAYQDPHF
jgi:hypothetical protein